MNISMFRSPMRIDVQILALVAFLTKPNDLIFWI